MKIGMPALIELSSIEENVYFANKLKLDFIELNMNFPYNFIENIEPVWLKKTSEDKNIEFTIHMPDAGDIGSLHDVVRAGYLKLFSDTIEWASKSGVKKLNFHIMTGPYMTLPDKKIYVYEKYSKEFTKCFLSSIEYLSFHATKHNITLCIENGGGNFGVPYVQDILNMAIKYDNVMLTWDTGHDYVGCLKDGEYFLKHIDKLSHMHFHDATENKDHLVPFDGKLDIKYLTEFAKKNNLTMLIEVKTLEAITRSVEILREKNLI